MPRGWRNNPEYKMSETHHDPVMRPSVDHLLFQLKNHKALKNRPDAVALVIKRMAYHFFRFEAERPANMFHTATDLMYQFLGQMGGGYPDANDEKMREFLVLSPGEAPQGENQNSNSEMGIKKVLEEGDKEKGEASGIFAHPTPAIDMDDPELRLGVEEMIAKHTLESDPGGSAAACSCGRPYPSEEKWAKHVRIRIWRYLQNEFRAD